MLLPLLPQARRWPTLLALRAFLLTAPGARGSLERSFGNGTTMPKRCGQLARLPLLGDGRVCIVTAPRSRRRTSLCRARESAAKNTAGREARARSGRRDLELQEKGMGEGLKPKVRVRTWKEGGRVRRQRRSAPRRLLPALLPAGIWHLSLFPRSPQVEWVWEPASAALSWRWVGTGVLGSCPKKSNDAGEGPGEQVL